MRKMKKYLSILLTACIIGSTPNISVLASGSSDTDGTQLAQTAGEVSGAETESVTEPVTGTEAEPVTEAETEPAAELITEETESETEPAAEAKIEKAEQTIDSNMGESPEIGAIAQKKGAVQKYSVLKNGSAAGDRNKNGFVFTQSDFQLTGLLFRKEKSYKVTVTGLEPGDPVPSIAFSQNLEHWGENIVNTAKLNNGAWSEDKTSVTKIITPPNDSYPGAIYIMNPYTADQQKGSNVEVQIEVSDGSHLEWYPLYVSGQDYEAFQQDLKDYKRLLEEAIAGYPNYTDVASDKVLITTSHKAAYDMYVLNKDDSGAAFNEAPESALQAYYESLQSMYEYAKLQPENYPRVLQQVRAIGMNLPFFATNAYVGFDNGNPSHYAYEVLKSVFANGWGPVHELGHVVENRTISFAETTNNLYVLNRMKQLNNGNDSYTTRLAKENRYTRLFSTLSSQKENTFFSLANYEVLNQNYTWDQLSNWDRLSMLDQLNQYFRHVTGREFWSEITEATRGYSFSGSSVNDSLNKIVLLAADKFDADIRPMFRISSLDGRFYLLDTFRDNMSSDAQKLVKKLDASKEIPATVRYIDETYAGNEDRALGANAKAVITKIEAKGTSNQLTIALEGDTAANLLGYEIYRVNVGTRLNKNKDFIGYVQGPKKDGETVSFSDTRNVASYLFDYYAVPIAKNLENGAVSAKKTSDGKSAETGEIQISEVIYHEMADEFSMKGNGYHPTVDIEGKGTLNAYIRVIINDQAYDIIENEQDPRKDYVHFIPNEEDGTWELRITNFIQGDPESDSRHTGEAGNQLEIIANYVSHESIDVDGEITDDYPVQMTSGSQIYNLGDIGIGGAHSPLLKSISVTGIKGNVEKRFDPMNLEYTGGKEYVKTSLSETEKAQQDPKVTIFTDPTAEMNIVPTLADIKASYEIYVTPYDADGTTLLTANRQEIMSDGISLSADRNSTVKWQAEIIVTDSTGEAANYVIDLYSPNENAYLNNLQVNNSKRLENGTTTDSSIKVAQTDFLRNDVLIYQGAKAGEDGANPVVITPDKASEAATIEYYRKTADGHLGDSYDPDGALTTAEFVAGTDLKVAVTAQDGVTLCEYYFVMKLDETAKSHAGMRDLELSGTAGNDQPAFVKQHDIIAEDEDQTALYHEKYSIAPVVDDSVEITIRPIVDYYYSGEEGFATCTWDVLKEDRDGTVTIETLKNSGIDCTLRDKDVVIIPQELKKLENGVYLRLTITSPDKSREKKILFCSVLSDRSPLLPYQNVSTNVMLYDWAVYTPENALNASVDNTLDPDKFDYVFIPNTNGEQMYFSPGIFNAMQSPVESLTEYVNGQAQEVQLGNNRRYNLSNGVTDFTYKVKSPDGTKVFSYNFMIYRSADSKLSGLGINGYLVHMDESGNYVPGFDSAVTEYYMITNDLDQLEIDPRKNDQKADTITTVDGTLFETPETPSANYARSLTAEQAMENNPMTDATKEVEISVVAENNSTATYTIIAANKFDFIEVDFVEDKTKLEESISIAAETAAKGNFDEVLYGNLKNAILNANLAVSGMYITEAEYEAALEVLETARTAYEAFLAEISEFAALYNDAMNPNGDLDQNELRSPVKLRAQLNGMTAAEITALGGGAKYDVLGWLVFDNTGKKIMFVIGNPANKKVAVGNYGNRRPSEITAYAAKGMTNVAQLDVNTDREVEIGYGAFEDCTNMTTIIMTNGGSWDKVQVSSRAFWNTKVPADTVPSDKVWIFDSNSSDTLTGSSIVANEMTVPGNVTEITPYAFYNMAGITTLNVPYGVAKIGAGAFVNATLEIANFHGNKLTLKNVFDSTVNVAGMDKVPAFTLQIAQVDEAGNSIDMHVRGAGIYNAGEKASIVAPFNGQYELAGWKHAMDDSDYFSSSAALQVEMKSDISIVAVYKETQKLTLMVDFDQLGGIIKKNNTEIVNAQVGDISLGDQVTLTAEAKPGYKFAGWYELGRLLSKGASYTVKVTANRTVKAEFVKNNQFTVTFKDVDGRILGMDMVEEGNAATAPAHPYRIGYTFVKWDKDFTNVTKNTEVLAVWEKEAVTYTVEAKNGAVFNNHKVSCNIFKFSDRAVVVADAPARGMKFSHWERRQNVSDTKGEIISYDSTYVFNVSNDLILAAVYAKEVTAQPLATTSSITVTPSIKKMVFVGQVTVPEGYEKVECGFVVYNKGVLEGDLTLNTARSVKLVSGAQNSVGQYSISVGVKTPGTVVYTKAYLTCKDKATGELFTVYSGLGQGTMS